MVEQENFTPEYRSSDLISDGKNTFASPVGIEKDLYFLPNPEAKAEKSSPTDIGSHSVA
jgi:hypothetical protein